MGGARRLRDPRARSCSSPASTRSPLLVSPSFHWSFHTSGQSPCKKGLNTLGEDCPPAQTGTLTLLHPLLPGPFGSQAGDSSIEARAGLKGPWGGGSP